MTKARNISKLSAVEVNATADQTDAEVKASVEAASDSNTFTDADHSKLNAIEASADVTDATNVTAAGALMDSELTNLAAVKAINQSLVTTASPTFSAVTTTGNVGIGTSSPNYKLEVYKSSVGNVASFNSSSGNRSLDITSADNGIYLGAEWDRNINSAGGIHTWSVNGTERMRIDSSGNVGIGEDASLGKLHVKLQDTGATANAVGNLLVLEGSENGLSILSGTSGAGYILFGDSDDNAHGGILYDQSAGAMRFRTGSTWDQMKILSDGKVGINEASPDRTLHVNSAGTNVVAKFESTDATASVEFTDNAGSAEVGCSGNDVVFFPAGTERMRVASNGYLIAQSASQVRLVLGSTGNSSNNTSNWIRGNGADLGYNAASGNHTFEVGGVERMRIDSSGNLLVGTTSTGAATASNGAYITPDGQIIGRSTSIVSYLNRRSSDGQILQFMKDGSAVGNIGTVSSSLFISSPSGNGTGLRFSNTVVHPCDSAGAPRDNALDLGYASGRFDDVYATNATIQTSDQTEKQDIASLTATEMLVAKRISALFKTFRWKDKVVEKGDNARTHTGIIAQDVQAAFTAEGLDAGDYSLFISSTWLVDSEGNEVAEGTEGAVSKTRMGIRYPELLSFVAAYNEQRFANIETRLTALEA